MNAVLNSLGVEQPFQQEMFGVKPIVKMPAICRQIVVGAQQVKAKVAKPESSAAGANPQAAEQARYISDAQREVMERVARTPIVPLAWIRGSTQVTPEEAGERKSGRPKLNVRRTLSVNDLDNSITYLQRRTRELQKLVKGAQPDTAHTTKIVTAAIKDAVRKLCANLPDEKRDAIDEVVAKF